MDSIKVGSLLNSQLIFASNISPFCLQFIYGMISNLTHAHVPSWMYTFALHTHKSCFSVDIYLHITLEFFPCMGDKNLDPTTP